MKPGEATMHALSKIMFWVNYEQKKDLKQGEKYCYYLDDVKVDMCKQSLRCSLEELFHTLVVISALTLALARYAHLYFGFDECHGREDEADVGKALLHDDRSHVRVLRRIAGLLDALKSHAVPLVLFADGELALKLQVDGVVRAQLHKLILFDVGAFGLNMDK